MHCGIRPPGPTRSGAGVHAFPDAGGSGRGSGFELHGEMDKFRHRVRVEFFHDMGTMGLDRTLAGVERCRDLLVQPALRYLLENLSFARRQAREVVLEVMSPVIAFPPGKIP